MAVKQREIRVVVDSDTDNQLDQLATEIEGRSKRGYAAAVLKRVARLEKLKPEELRRLGIVRPEVEMPQTAA
jgi:hypothetical protein